MPVMKWSPEPPTRPGSYWAISQTAIDPKPFIVTIREEPAGSSARGVGWVTLHPVLTACLAVPFDDVLWGDCIPAPTLEPRR